MPSGEQYEERADRVDPPTDQELAEMLQRQYELNPRMAEVSEFISLTGLRWSELRASRIGRIQDVPFPGPHVSRAQSDGYAEKGTKTKNSRTVPLTARAYEIARKHAGTPKASDYLFVTPTGKQLRGNRFRRAVRWTDRSALRNLESLQPVRAEFAREESGGRSSDRSGGTDWRENGS